MEFKKSTKERWLKPIRAQPTPGSPQTEPDQYEAASQNRTQPQNDEGTCCQRQVDRPQA